MKWNTIVALLQSWKFQWILKLQKKIFMYKTELDSVLSPVIINKVFHLVHMNVWWDI